MAAEPGRAPDRGPIAWMASNRVAANLLMAVLIGGGLLFAFGAKQEVFPQVDLDVVTVSVPYPGATPVEVEQGVVLAVESAVRGIEGVEEVRASAREGLGVVNAELFADANANEALNDIKAAVDRITSFPEEAEEPEIRLQTNRVQVISLILHGDLPLETLEDLAESARQDLLQTPGITLVELAGVPPPEISVEVPQAELRRYGLTLQEIARRVGAGTVELGGGGLETPGGEVLVRTRERAETGDEVADIVVVAAADGTRVRVGDIARVVDGYRDTEEAAWYEGERAVRVNVFRVGDQSPLAIAEDVKAYRDRLAERLPATVGVAVWEDRSRIYADRIGLLVENGQLGVLLVLALLGVFLAPRLAFWVTVGIPVSFLGVFLFMPALDVSINMVSLFAFLLVLGIVVDDAIVVGEAVSFQREQGLAPLEAAVAGTREVVVPVTFAVLTTMVAFMPLLFVPGVLGEFFVTIPLIVIPLLLLSLVESMYVLPAHLAHVSRREGTAGGLAGPVLRLQDRVARALRGFVRGRYRPFLERVLDAPGLALAVALAVLAVFVGLVAGQRLSFVFMPEIEGDLVTASIELPFGAPEEATRRVALDVSARAREAAAELPGGGELIEGIYLELGSAGPSRGPAGGGGIRQGAHVAYVSVELVSAERRAVGAEGFSEHWREAVGEVPGVDRIAYTFTVGPAAGAAVAIELAHDDRRVLERAATELAAELRDYAGVRDVDAGYATGKEELELELRPGARSLGVTAEDLARQVRSAFFGAEAERQQRGRDELRIYVRLPEADRSTEHTVEELIVRTPRGGEMPLEQAASIERGRSFTQIEREQGRRVITVTGDVDEAVTTGGEVTASLEESVLPRMMERHPGLAYEVGGQQQERRESLAALGRGFALALLVMYAMMAVVFRSYLQPALVMFAIPFGLVGAVLGHLLLGFNLSLVSVFGLVALAGVVVNDSLVLIAAVDQRRRAGSGVREALLDAGERRFRPVLLTSLTTFFGLAPMIFETSIQARFLIPMALSLGFGVLFVTLIALVVVPAAYMLAENARAALRRTAL